MKTIPRRENLPITAGTASSDNRTGMTQPPTQVFEMAEALLRNPALKSRKDTSGLYQRWVVPRHAGYLAVADRIPLG